MRLCRGNGYDLDQTGGCRPPSALPYPGRERQAMSPVLSVVVWNVQFRRRDSSAGKALRAAIAGCTPDIVCLTEAVTDFLDGANSIDSEADYGYRQTVGRRKVMLWSRAPWHSIDRLGDEGMPGGRYIAGCTATPLGDVAVHGLCVPWQHAHVATGRRDRAPWQEHVQYLESLRRVLAAARRDRPLLVLGDFNQTVPRRRAPARVFHALSEAIPGDLQYATAGLIPPLSPQSIDHGCHSAKLVPLTVVGLPNIGSDGKLLSDHFGLHLRNRPA
jgi:endonuclease/exonuclease/phosphatase family metal-dependent hydrolase